MVRSKYKPGQQVYLQSTEGERTKWVKAEVLKKDDKKVRKWPLRILETGEQSHYGNLQELLPNVARITCKPEVLKCNTLKKTWRK